jgi:predicted alpha-1,2-mannosidase
MKKQNFFAILSLTLLLTACTERNEERGENFTQYVNLMIGTGGHGHTFPGAVVPHGMVQLSPGTRTNGWDACSGYHFNDTALIGFAHQHLSGTGIGDLGDFLFLPFTGQLRMVPQYMHDDGRPPQRDRDRYGSFFSREGDGEIAVPGFYSVYMICYGIRAELTASTRVGFHRYTFPDAEKAGLFIDLERTIHSRRVYNSEFRVISDTEIQGMKQVHGWAPNRFVYFHAEFSEPFEVEQICDLFAYLKFSPKKAGDQVLVKVGISYVDFDGAKNNMHHEVPHWDFDRVKREADRKWNQELSRVRITTDDTDARTKFYTALYRTAIHPSIASDVDGRFRTMEQKIEKDPDYTNFYVFSMWDTFRTLHPLNTVIRPEINQAMIRSLIRKSEEGGLLPMWELHSNYTGCMIGYHAVSVIVDAFMKGQRDFDVETAFRAIKKKSTHDTINVSPTINRYVLHNLLMPISRYYKNTLGWVPADRIHLSVARGLEYAYNDWVIAQMARELGYEEYYRHFSELGRNFRHYFDPSTGLMRGKLYDGSWRYPFNPIYSDHFADDYCEGNAWQWSFFVPHDINGLAELHGGREALITKLDTLFSMSSEIEGERASADITGMIGQYAHGNQPSHFTIHMYNVLGEPWKTQSLVDYVLFNLYFNDVNGLSGNEDAGQMSAWFAMNAMGFFSHCPGLPYYSIGRPIFDEVVINLENGNTFTIIAHNQSRANKFIKSARLNGSEMETLFISHEDIMNGGVLEFEMTNVSPGPLPWVD